VTVPTAEAADERAREKPRQRLLSVCSYCRKLRDDGNTWRRVEEPADDTGARVSHGTCPDCWEKVVLPEFGGADQRVVKAGLTALGRGRPRQRALFTGWKVC
jgi:hypothetical protein